MRRCAVNGAVLRAARFCLRDDAACRAIRQCASVPRAARSGMRDEAACRAILNAPRCCVPSDPACGGFACRAVGQAERPTVPRGDWVLRLLPRFA
jgi:hypothetical protein